MVEISARGARAQLRATVSVLYREPMWLKCDVSANEQRAFKVSVLYREPMWLKYRVSETNEGGHESFSALP